MQRYLSLMLVGMVAVCRQCMAADPQYTTSRWKSTLPNRLPPSGRRWGGYCDITKWLDVTDCVIKSGDGWHRHRAPAPRWTGHRDTRGEDRPLLRLHTTGTRGQFYNLYHGFLEAKP
jgi:hypothetical protein